MFLCQLCKSHLGKYISNFEYKEKNSFRISNFKLFRATEKLLSTFEMEISHENLRNVCRLLSA